MEAIIVWLVYVAIFIIVSLTSRGSQNAQWRKADPDNHGRRPRQIDWRKRLDRVSDPRELAEALSSSDRGRSSAAAERLSAVVWQQIRSGQLDSIASALHETIRFALPLHGDHPNLVINILKLLETAGDEKDLAVLDRMTRSDHLWGPVRTAAEQCRDHVRTRLEPEMTLLRPSVQPSDSNVLLHPASGGQAESPEQLLRAVNQGYEPS